MKQRYRREPPAKGQHGGTHLGGAAVDDKKDDEQETEKRGDDERSEIAWLPVRARFAPEDCAGLRSPREIVYQQSSPRWSAGRRPCGFMNHHARSADSHSSCPFRGLAGDGGHRARAGSRPDHPGAQPHSADGAGGASRRLRPGLSPWRRKAATRPGLPRSPTGASLAAGAFLRSHGVADHCACRHPRGNAIGSNGWPQHGSSRPPGGQSRTGSSCLPPGFGAGRGGRTG